MNSRLIIKWGIQVLRTCWGREWSFGIGVSRAYPEIYLWVNLFKHVLYIGKFTQEVKL